MDAFTFAAKIISLLVWPMVVVAIAMMMRDPVGRFLIALKDKDVEITFKEWSISFKSELTELSHCLDSSKNEDIVLAQEKINNMLKKMEDDCELYGNILKKQSK